MLDSSGILKRWTLVVLEKGCPELFIDCQVLCHNSKLLVKNSVEGPNFLLGLWCQFSLDATY